MEISSHIKEGFRVLQDHPAEVIFGYVIVFFVSFFSFGILAGPMAVGYTDMLNGLRNGQEGGVSRMFDRAFQNVGDSILAISLPVFVVLFAGFLLNFIYVGLQQILILGLTLLYLYWIAPVLVIERVDWQEGMQKAWEFGTGGGDRVIFALVLSLLSSLGTAICFIGVFLTTPISMYAALEGYIAETSEEEAPDEPADSPDAPEADTPSEETTSEEKAEERDTSGNDEDRDNL